MGKELAMLRASEFHADVVAWRPDQMYGWPSLTRAASGDLLVGASECKHHRPRGGHPLHRRGQDLVSAARNLQR